MLGMVRSASMASAAVAIAVVAALMLVEPTLAFGVGPASRGSIGNVENKRGASSSSFVRAGSQRRTGESSSTSLSSSYVVKPEMARSRTCEWRKLRTRGPGFGEKVCGVCPFFRSCCELFFLPPAFFSSCSASSALLLVLASLAWSVPGHLSG